jgi:hypothetical protein
LLVGLQLAAAEPTGEEFRLSGIVNLPEFKLAAIETERNSRSVRSAFWREFQRDGNLTIRQIDPESGSVSGAINKTNPVTFRLEKRATQSSNPLTIQFDNLSLNALLTFYGTLSQRSVLQSPRLPRATFSAQTDTTNHVEILALLERLLLDREISIIRDGEKFVAVLPKAEAARYEPKAPPMKSKDPADSSDDMPPGSINFESATLFQCLTIYAEFVGKKLDQASLRTLPDRGPIVFHNYNALTKAECSYALGTLLRMHGVELLPATNGLVNAVSIPEGAR